MDIWNKLKSFFALHQAKDSEKNDGKSSALLWFQIVLIILLILTIFLIYVVDCDGYRVLYLAVVAGLTLIMLGALKLNLLGKYKISAWWTIIEVSLGPWIPILTDEHISKGDFVPLIYIVLSIQFCAVFLSERATITIAVIQFISMVVFVFSSPFLIKMNLSSFFAYLLFASTLGILSSFLSRKQMEKIEKQNDKLQDNEIKMRELLIRDPLTGLYNRSYINEILDKFRYDKCFAVFMFDIDKLKYVNDNFGHLEGDKLIISAANVLKNCFRETDILARMGGDEFMTILPECNIQMAEMFKDRIREAIADYNATIQDAHLNVSISIGFSVVKNEDDTIDTLMQKADELMYVDKLGKRV